MEDFNLITEDDKQHFSYGVCMAGTVGSGMLVGGAVPAFGSVVGAVAGVAWGLLVCKHLQAPIKKKLFSSRAHMSEHEILASLRVIRQNKPGVTKKQALDYLAQARREISRHPQKYASA